MKLGFAIVFFAVFFCSPVFAQGKLGFTGASLDYSVQEDEFGTLQQTAQASVDINVTGVHGLQGRLSFEETAFGTIGSLQSHLYMSPDIGQKYGLFIALSDVDGRSLAWGSAGAAGIFEVSERATFAAHVGLGAADAHGLDYIFGELSWTQDLSDHFRVEFALSAADFDEAAFRATSIETSLRAEYMPDGSNWGAYALVTQSSLSGRDGRPSATRLGLGVTYQFGQVGQTRAEYTHFGPVDPVAPLVRRGLM